MVEMRLDAAKVLELGKEESCGVGGKTRLLCPDPLVGKNLSDKDTGASHYLQASI
jgi:hypothetical protein